MPNLDDLNTQLTAYNEALDRVADKIAIVKNDPEVKAALVRQYEELKKLKSFVETKLKEQEIIKVGF